MLVKLNNQIFGTTITKQGVIVITVGPCFHATIKAGSPRIPECGIDVILGGFPYLDG